MVCLVIVAVEKKVAGYPIVLDLSGRRCLVVGGGPVALRKVRGLVGCGARVRIVAREVIPALRAYVETEGIELAEKPYESGDLRDVTLVISATDDTLTNRRVAADAGAQGILVNVVDQPDLCSFTVPAVVHRGDLTIAVATFGKSPALAKSIREKLEKQFGDEYGPYVDFLGRVRQWIEDRFPNDPEKRRAASCKVVQLNLIDHFRKDQGALAEEEAKRCISSLSV